MFLNISNAQAPVRKRKIRNSHNPWLTLDLKRSMFERDKLKKIAVKYKTSENWQLFKVAWNEVIISEGMKCSKAWYYNYYFRETVVNIRES